MIIVYLTVSALIFGVGLAAVLTKRPAVLALVGIELMVNAANVNFFVFWKLYHSNKGIDGYIFPLFSIAVAAAEAAVGLALIVAIHRQYKTTAIDRLSELKG